MKKIAVLLNMVLLLTVSLSINSFAEKQNGNTFSSTTYQKMSKADHALENYTDEIMQIDGSQFSAAPDSAYLEINIQKEKENNCVTVLEYTEWQLSARFVRTETDDSGHKTVTTMDVTEDCDWKSSDKSGKTLQVDTSSGFVTAGRESTALYSIQCTYVGTVNDVDENGNKVEVKKTFKGGLSFRVKRLEIDANSAEALRILAYTYLANDEWNSMVAFQGSKVEDFIQAQYENSSSSIPVISNQHNSSLTAYIQSSPQLNSARILHFLSAAAGSSRIEKCISKSDVNAIVFSNNGNRYLCFSTGSSNTSKGMAASFNAIEGNGTRRFAVLVGYEQYSNLFNQGISIYTGLTNRNLSVIGSYFGGTIAKYVAYVHGCPSYTINAPSPLQYVIWYNTFELCKLYNVYQQVSYNYPALDIYLELYQTEPWYYVYPDYSNTIPFLRYNYKREVVSIDRSEKKLEKKHKLWNRDVYLGDSSDEVFNDNFSSVIDPSSWIKLQNTLIFSGSGNDKSIARTDWQFLLSIFSIAEDSKGLVEAILTKGLSGFITGKIFALPLEMYAHSPIKDNIFHGGKGDDKFVGTEEETLILYCYGDGFDEYYFPPRHQGSFVDLCIMGCDSGQNITISDNKYDEEKQYEYVDVTIDGIPAIRFYSDIHDTPYYLYVFRTNDPFHDLNKNTIIGKRHFGVSWVGQYRTHCPVDMYVYDQTGNVVQSLLDGQESNASTEYGWFDVSLENGEYVKNVLLFDESYRVEIHTRENGYMDYSVGFYNFESEEGECRDLHHIYCNKGTIFHGSTNLDDAILLVDDDGDGNIDRKIEDDTTIQLPESSITMHYGEKLQLQSEVTNSVAEVEYCFISCNEDVVQIDDNGLMTAVGFGDAQIIVYAMDGSNIFNECSITVPEEVLSAENFIIKGLKEHYKYTSKPIEPEFEVFYNELPLSFERDYSVSFSELVFPGDGILTITGLGNYTGTKTISYEIVVEHADTIEDAIQIIISQLREEGITGEWESALWLHDWLVNNANYDYTYTWYDPEGVLIYGTGVCQSYAIAFSELLNEMGIENTIVSSQEMDHAWNLVKIGGEWCHIDCTWDDPGIGGLENHTYFGMNDGLIARDHIWDRNSYTNSASLQNYYPIRNGELVFANDNELNEILTPLFTTQAESFSIVYIGTDPAITVQSAFEEWYINNNWKYGIRSFSTIYDDYSCSISNISYTEPWTEPVNKLSNPVDAPAFSMNSPDGNFNLGNYHGNGLVLIFGREGCINTRGLLERLEAELEDLHDNGIEVLISVENAETYEDILAVKQDYPSFYYCYEQQDLMSEYLEAVDYYNTYDTYMVTYPCVFIINGEGKITYYSTGYVPSLDEFVSEAFATSNTNPLPIPPENQYTVAETGNANIYYIADGNVKRALLSACEESTGVFFLTDSGLYYRNQTMLNKWEENYSLFQSMGLSFVVRFREITEEERQAYPHITFVDYDEFDNYFPSLLYQVNWDYSYTTSSLCTYFIEHDGHIADYRNGSTLSIWEKIAVLVRDMSYDMVFPAQLQTIDDEAFYGSSFASVDLGSSSVVSIGNMAFSNCQNLRFIRLPDSLVHIDPNAFLYTDKVIFVCKRDSASADFAEANNILCVCP